jgi:hypothetical protein
MRPPRLGARREIPWWRGAVIYYIYPRSFRDSLRRDGWRHARKESDVNFELITNGGVSMTVRSKAAWATAAGISLWLGITGAVAADRAKVLNIYAWSEYFPAALIAKFQTADTVPFKGRAASVGPNPQPYANPIARARA